MTRAGRRLVMTLLVRDEADVIARNLRWHLAHGVEHAIVTDNGSTDGTVEAIEPFVAEGAVTLLHEPSPDYLQDVWATRMAVLARERHGADWILSNDADEFWRPPPGPDGRGDLRDALPEPAEDAPTGLSCRRLNLVAARDALGAAPWPEVLIHRAEPAPPLVEPADRLRGALGAPYFHHALAPKLLLSARGLRHIKRGAHEAFFEGRKARVAPCEVEILHVPVRSRGEFERSVRRIGRAVGADPALAATTSWKYRRWLAMTEAAGSIWPAFRDAMPSRARLAAELERGAAVRDTRLRDELAALEGGRGRGPAPATAAPPCEERRREPLGEVVLIAGSGPGRPEAFARLLGLRGAVRPAPRPDGRRVASEVELVHDAVLAQAGDRGPWGPVADPAEAAALHGESLLDALLADHAGLAPAVVDDPRLPFLLPFWRAVASAHDLGLAVLIAVDDPLAPDPDGPPLQPRLTRWLRRALAAERGSRGLRRLVLRADALPGDWRGVLRGVEARLLPGLPRAQMAPEAEIDAALAALAPPDGPGDDALMAAPAVPEAIKECHEALTALAAGADGAAMAPVLDRLAAELDAALERVGPSLAGLEAARAGLASRLAAQERRRADLADRLAAAGREVERLERERDRAAETSRAERSRRVAAERAAVVARLASAPGGRLRTAVATATGRRRRAVAEIEAAPEFDARWYLTRHPDVARSGLSPAEHYLRHGAREGRDPGPAFDTVFYYATHRDVLAAGANALLHYVRSGRGEGRRTAPAGTTRRTPR